MDVLVASLYFRFSGWRLLTWPEAGELAFFEAPSCRPAILLAKRGGLAGRLLRALIPPQIKPMLLLLDGESHVISRLAIDALHLAQLPRRRPVLENRVQHRPGRDALLPRIGCRKGAKAQGRRRGTSALGPAVPDEPLPSRAARVASPARRPWAARSPREGKGEEDHGKGNPVRLRCADVVDAVAGLARLHCGGEDSPCDISRGMFAGEVGSPAPAAPVRAVRHQDHLVPSRRLRSRPFPSRWWRSPQPATRSACTVTPMRTRSR